jgi:hypothetical protein
VKIDWDAGHGPITGPINCGLTALTVGWAGNVAGMPTSWAAVAAGAGWLGTHIAGVRKGVTGTTLAMRTAAWLGAGAWCSVAIADSPWSTWSLGALVAGALGLGGAMAGAHHVEEKVAEAKAEAEVAAKKASLDGQRAALATEWDKRIAEVCTGLLVQIVGVEHWESGAGYIPSLGRGAPRRGSVRCVHRQRSDCRRQLPGGLLAADHQRSRPGRRVPRR